MRFIWLLLPAQLQLEPQVQLPRQALLPGQHQPVEVPSHPAPLSEAQSVPEQVQPPQAPEQPVPQVSRRKRLIKEPAGKPDPLLLLISYLCFLN